MGGGWGGGVLGQARRGDEFVEMRASGLQSFLMESSKHERLTSDLILQFVQNDAQSFEQLKSRSGGEQTSGNSTATAWNWLGRAKQMIKENESIQVSSTCFCLRP